MTDETKEIIETLTERISRLIPSPEVATETQAGELEQKVKADQKLIELKEREVRWHEASRNQLSFFNNLLIVLGSGFLGFAFKDTKISAYHFIIDCSSDFNFTVLSLTTMGLSVLIGILCSYNRILDFRYIFKTARIKRKLMEATQEAYKAEKVNDVYPPIFYWFSAPNFKDVEDEDYSMPEKIEAIKTKISRLTRLTKKMGPLTRLLAKIQTVLFFLSILCYVVSLCKL